MPLSDIETRTSHLRHGLKTGLAALLAYCLTVLLGLEFGFWAVLTAVIVMQIKVADSIQMSLHRISGTTIGAALGVTALLLLPQKPLYTGIALFLVVGCCAYLTRYNPRYKMAAITAVIVLLAGSGAAMTHQERVLFGTYRVLEILLGVLCAMAVSVGVWPVGSGATLKEHLERQFTRCADAYSTLTEAFLSKQRNAPVDMMADLDGEVRENRPLLDKALRHERLIFNSDTALMSLQVEMLERCLEHLHAALAAVNTIPDVPGQGFSLIMEEEIRALARDSEEAMRTLGQGRTPDVLRLRGSLDEAQIRLAALREEGVTRRFHLRKLLQIMSFMNTLQAMAEDILRGVQRMENLRPKTEPAQMRENTFAK